jgi:hypothetical protein
MITMSVLPVDLQRALQKIDRYAKEKQKELWIEVKKSGFEIDKKQKQKLRYHSAISGKNYAAMIAANRTTVNEEKKIFTIDNSHKAAVFFEQGTKPHKIRIKNKKVLSTLREYTGGKALNVSKDKKGNEWAIFGLQVNHPGTKPKPFFVHPVLAVGKIMVQKMRKILLDAK